MITCKYCVSSIQNLIWYFNNYYIYMYIQILVVRFVLYLVTSGWVLHLVTTDTYKMDGDIKYERGVIYYRHFDGWKANLEDWLPTFHL